MFYKDDSKANKATIGRGRKRKLTRKKISKFCFLGKGTEILLTQSHNCERKRYCKSSNEVLGLFSGKLRKTY